MKHRDLIAGEKLYLRGDRVKFVFAVETGRLHLLSQSADGRPVTIYVARAGECVSEVALFADHCCCDAVAETDTQVVAFPKAPLLEALRKQPDLSVEFMTMLAARFDAVKTRLELRSLLSARERVIQYLLLTKSPGTNEVLLDRPLAYVAEDLGLAPESFYRVLAQLRKDGSITRHGRSIFLHSVHNTIAKAAT